MLRQIIVMFCSLFFLCSALHGDRSGAGANRGALFKVQQGATRSTCSAPSVGAADFYPLEPQYGRPAEEGAGAGAGDRSARRSAKLARAVQQHGLNSKAMQG
jgi:hypothetical protein